MKKIVRQQNYLKELIESQDNKILSKQALKCLIRAVLEPLLDNPESGVVLHRITDKNGVVGLLKRLEFSEVEGFDFSDESGNIKEKVWANTEFICVMTHRFVSIILWLNNSEDAQNVKYYSLYNSKLQNEAIDIIDRNSIIDLRPYQEKYKPDRRDNILLNSSLRKMVENLDEASNDAVLGFAEGQATTKTVEYKPNTRFVAHEIRNQLSITDLYTEVIRKYCEKNNIESETITNALDCLTRSVKLANNSLLTLKNINSLNMEACNLKEIVENVHDLTKVYFECKNIEYVVENNVEETIFADKDKISAVLINLIKNGIEAFNIEDDNDLNNGKYIKIVTEKDGEFGVIRVSNNAGKIENSEKVFEVGYTTKTSGSGLGLAICKNSMEEQSGSLALEHSDKDYTEFVLRIGLV